MLTNKGIRLKGSRVLFMLEQKAKELVKKLVDAGYLAYFAGGWVRDFLRGEPSHDIDIATSAKPEEVMELFERSFAVGLSFGVVRVIFEEEIFEVASFRADGAYVNGRQPTSICFCDAKTDALRRDFSINGMFYDPLEEKIYDYVGGQEDLKRGLVRAIGDPWQRFEEDRLRILRAVRFSARLSFAIEENTQKAIIDYADKLFPAVSVERVWQEFKQMVKDGNFSIACQLMQDLGLIEKIFPKARLNEKTVAVLQALPKNCAAVLAFMQLFLHLTLKERLEVCAFLKMSSREKDLLELYEMGALLAEEESMDFVNDVQWAHFYAKEDAWQLIELLALQQKNPESFLQKRQEQRKRLEPFVQRIVLKKPLLTSEVLLKRGIKGPLLGKLLKEAENISISEALEDQKKLLELLQKSPLWPEGL